LIQQKFSLKNQIFSQITKMITDLRLLVVKLIVLYADDSVA
jgi:hypothetical protein